MNITPNILQELFNTNEEQKIPCSNKWAREIAPMKYACSILCPKKREQNVASCSIFNSEIRMLCLGPQN